MKEHVPEGNLFEKDLDAILVALLRLQLRLLMDLPLPLFFLCGIHSRQDTRNEKEEQEANRDAAEQLLQQLDALVHGRLRLC